MHEFNQCNVLKTQVHFCKCQDRNNNADWLMVSSAGPAPYLSGERVMVIVSESSVHGHPGSMM